MRKKTPSVDIIIVNWNAGRQLLECLESIEMARQETFNLKRTVVVDNDSSDGSLEAVGSVDLPLTIIGNSQNLGFAAACNQGAKDSHADYLLFLNPDTRLFADSLSKPIDLMEQPENQTIGICGIKLIDDTGNVARMCARFPAPRMYLAKILGLDHLCPHIIPGHLMREWDHLENRSVDQIMGAFFLARRSLFLQLNGFDNRFFVYFEEVDFSLRARTAGWHSLYIADASVYHKGGGTSQQVKPQRLFYNLRSRIQYSYKHFDPKTATIVTLATLLVEFFTRLCLAVFRHSLSQIRETFEGYMILYLSLPDVLKTVLRDYIKDKNLI